jgi:uracil-DNA glycosylase
MATYPGAERWVPPRADLRVLDHAIQDCPGCDLYRDATQAVLGEGPDTARVALVGEQPGDLEDKAGRPFVGPAGRLLNRALADAGIDRDDTYVTNAVKHFRFTTRGKASGGSTRSPTWATSWPVGPGSPRSWPSSSPESSWCSVRSPDVPSWDRRTG